MLHKALTFQRIVVCVSLLSCSEDLQLSASSDAANPAEPGTENGPCFSTGACIPPLECSWGVCIRLNGFSQGDGGLLSDAQIPGGSSKVPVTPSQVSVPTSQSQQFTARVVGQEQDTVTWSIDGSGSGSVTVGFISATGEYTAPTIVPSPAVVVIRATSTAIPALTNTAVVTVVSPTEDWPKYRHDLSNTGRSAETGISSNNVENLREKWSFDTMSGISSSPVVATIDGDRTVFVGSRNGRYFALDALTGAEKWRFDISPDNPAQCSGQPISCPGPDEQVIWPNPVCWITSTGAVASGKVYFGTHNGHFYAVDAKTGILAWKRQLGSPCDGGAIWSSPAVYQGVVYVGYASHQSEPCVLGKVCAFNAATGNPVWNANDSDSQSRGCIGTIDRDLCPGCKGGGVWSSPAIDTRYDTLFVGTGNSGRGCAPKTANTTKYPDGIIALSLADGSIKGFHQTIFWSVKDEGDVGAPPVLHQTVVEDECSETTSVRYWVSAPSKDGYFWTWERDTGGFVTAMASGGTPALDCLAEAQAVCNCQCGGPQTSICESLGGPRGGPADCSFFGSPDPVQACVDAAEQVCIAPFGRVTLPTEAHVPFTQRGNTVTGPGVVPIAAERDCDNSGKKLRTTGNRFFVPTGKGQGFASIQQGDDGVTSLWKNTQLHDCVNDGGAPCPLYSPPSTITDLLFFGGGDGAIYAANTEGEVVWSFGTGGTVVTSPAISNSRIYFGSYDGKVYCVSINGD